MMDPDLILIYETISGVRVLLGDLNRVVGRNYMKTIKHFICPSAG